LQLVIVLNVTDSEIVLMKLGNFDFEAKGH